MVYVFFPAIHNIRSHSQYTQHEIDAIIPTTKRSSSSLVCSPLSLLSLQYLWALSYLFCILHHLICCLPLLQSQPLRRVAITICHRPSSSAGIAAVTAETLTKPQNVGWNTGIWLIRLGCCWPAREDGGWLWLSSLNAHVESRQSRPLLHSPCWHRAMQPLDRASFI